MAEASSDERAVQPSDAWSDLALTLPLFVAYHLGVVFLPVRNAADLVTRELVKLANDNLAAYAGLTLAVGLAFVGVLALFGRREELRVWRFAWILAEGIAYAVAMRLLAGTVVGSLPLAALAETGGRLGAIVLSIGAGFYEEIAFRVALFGLGAKILKLFAEPISVGRGRLITLGWAIVAAAVFSGWHYVGALGDTPELRSFLFRWICGLVFTVIYAFRGFAPVVWTHVVYDVWVLAF